MLRGYFAVGICGGKTPDNTGTLWRSAHCLGAAFMFTVGCRYTRYHDTTKADLSIPLLQFDTLDELVRALPEKCALVGVELHESAESIRSFEHPEQACYLLGAEDRGLDVATMAQCDRIIQLPGAYCLNVAVAGSIVMYDRWKS